MWDDDRWVSWAAIAAGVIVIGIGLCMMLGANMEENTVLKACASTGEIEMQSGALKIHIKCSIDGVGV